jgi:hypothetical protein
MTVAGCPHRAGRSGAACRRYYQQRRKRYAHGGLTPKKMVSHRSTLDLIDKIDKAIEKVIS